ncbi:MAG: hypothetical protein ACLQBQ_05785 [Smithella sp.]
MKRFIEGYKDELFYVIVINSGMTGAVRKPYHPSADANFQQVVKKAGRVEIPNHHRPENNNVF